jgi:hypothetical protein
VHPRAISEAEETTSRDLADTSGPVTPPCRWHRSTLLDEQFNLIKVDAEWSDHVALRVPAASSPAVPSPCRVLARYTRVGPRQRRLFGR